MAGITSVAWARDEGNVTTGNTKGLVQTWDVLTREPRRTYYLLGPPSAVSSVAYSPDGKHLAVGFSGFTIGTRFCFGSGFAPPDSQTVSVLDTATGEITLTLEGAGGSVAYSSDGTHLASVWKDGGQTCDPINICDPVVAQIWDTATGNLMPLDGPDFVKKIINFVGSVAYSPDGTHLAQTLYNPLNAPRSSILIWNTATGELTNDLGAGQCYYSVTYSPSGSYLASGEEGEVTIWDTATGERNRTLTHGVGAVYSVSYSPDGKYLASGGADGTVKI